MKKAEARSFLDTIKYCISLSWQSSKLYTTVRLAVKVFIPINTILVSFILKNIINILTAPSDDTAKYHILLLITATVAISLITVVANKAVAYCESMHNDILERYITLNMMDKSLKSDLEMYDNPVFYDKFTSVKFDYYAVTYILWNALDCMSALITFVSVVCVLSVQNAFYCVLIVLASFPSGIISQRYTKILYQLGLSQMNDERQKMYVYQVASTKGYAQEVRLFNIGDRLKSRYMAIWTAVFKKKKNQVKKRTIYTVILGLLPEIAIGFVTVDVAFKVLAGNATVGDYSLYTGLIAQLSTAIYTLIASGSNIYENKLKIANVKSFDTLQKNLIIGGDRKLQNIETIEFSNVTFKYPETEKYVLNGLNFHINRGEKIGIVGVNGAGKSTIIKLLMRFYDVTGGQILLNGIDIKEYDINSLRDKFSCYFQNAPNYGFTLKENIELADINKAESQENITNALKNSDALDVVKKLPDGIDTYITRMFSDKGVELSVGQSQKVALARSFYRDREVMIFDEPSSSLDPEAENELFLRLENLSENKTTLFVSHRLSNINLADYILVVENGRTVEFGSKQELLNKHSRFAQLYDYQLKKYTE